MRIRVALLSLLLPFFIGRSPSLTHNLLPPRVPIMVPPQLVTSSPLLWIRLPTR
jgi:hypothetical protein